MRAYDAEIAQADRLVGRLIASLGERLARTHVIVVSDHGESLDDLIERHGYAFDHGEFLYAHQLHVPWIWSHADFEPARVAAQVSLLDLAPTVLEAPIQVECRVVHELDLPPSRRIFLADVVATTVHEDVCDPAGRLDARRAAPFGMTAGSGEFFALGARIGRIGQSVGRDDIRY